jgi:hypothetical protein
MISHSVNEQGDEIGIYPDGVILNFSYWDCACDDNYIKPVSQEQCSVCNCHIDECPSAREEEVQQFIYKTGD